MILFDLAELEEFAEALIVQLSAEITEEKEITGLASNNEDANFTLKFDEIELILQNSPFFMPFRILLSH